jgi:hypothetical protein
MDGRWLGDAVLLVSLEFQLLPQGWILVDKAKVSNS